MADEEEMKLLHWVVIALIVIVPLNSAFGNDQSPPIPRTPPHPPLPPAHLLKAGPGPSLEAVSALALPPLKAVLLVGPIDGDDGSWTTQEKDNMDLAAAELEANGVTVYKFYTPNNNWAQITAAANGAHFLFYRGHGVYWGEMPSPPVGGFALKDRFASADDIRNDLHLAPNAIIMLYGCFTAGSASNDPAPISSAEAQRRVAQYSDPFFDIGASGYYADWFGNAFQMFVRYLFQGQTLGQAYESYADFNSETVEHYSHPDHPTMAMWLDKDFWDGQWQYNNAFAGLPDYRLEDIFQIPPDHVFISGSPDGLIGESYAFTATISPDVAGRSVSYTWEATDQMSVSHTGSVSDVVHFSWDTPGPKVVKVTAMNRAGSAASEHAIVINVPLAQVTVGGPTSGVVYTRYSFAAEVSPSTATQPITYTWQASDQATLTHVGGWRDTASFQWSTPGFKTVMITAVNAAGAITSRQTIAIYVPLSSISISGTTTGYVNTPYSFTAYASPNTASQPLSYTWQADDQALVTHVGGSNDTATFSWGEAGLHVLTVTANNAGNHAVVASHTVTVTSGPCLTLDPNATSSQVLSYIDSQGNATTVTFPPQAVLPAITFCYEPLVITHPPMAGWNFAGRAFKLEAFMNGSLWPTLIFFKPLTITIYYEDIQGVRPDSLTLYHWGATWEQAASTCGGSALLPQRSAQSLSTSVCSLGEFALLGQGFRLYMPSIMQRYTSQHSLYLPLVIKAGYLPVAD